MPMFGNFLQTQPQPSRSSPPKRTPLDAALQIGKTVVSDFMEPVSQAGQAFATSATNQANARIQHMQQRNWGAMATDALGLDPETDDLKMKALGVAASPVNGVMHAIAKPSGTALYQNGVEATPPRVALKRAMDVAPLAEAFPGLSSLALPYLMFQNRTGPATAQGLKDTVGRTELGVNLATLPLSAEFDGVRAVSGEPELAGMLARGADAAMGRQLLNPGNQVRAGLIKALGQDGLMLDDLRAAYEARPEGAQPSWLDLAHTASGQPGGAVNTQKYLQDTVGQFPEIAATAPSPIAGVERTGADLKGLGYDVLNTLKGAIDVPIPVVGGIASEALKTLAGKGVDALYDARLPTRPEAWEGIDQGLESVDPDALAPRTKTVPTLPLPAKALPVASAQNITSNLLSPVTPSPAATQVAALPRLNGGQDGNQATLPAPLDPSATSLDNASAQPSNVQWPPFALWH